MQETEKPTELELTEEMRSFCESYVAGAVREKLGLSKRTLQTVLALAQRKAEAGQFNEALRTSALVMIVDPGDIRNMAGFANCAVAAGQPKLVLRVANAMVRLEPDNPLGYYFSAVACLGLGHLAEAQEDARLAMQYAEEQGNSDMYIAARQLATRLRLN